MNSLAYPNDTLKEGVYIFMKNFFLYLKSKTFINNCYDHDDMYFFENNRIIAISRNEYNAEKRYALQQELGIRPYYITQNVFKEFLLYLSCNYQDKIILMYIDFIDRDITDTPEYLELLDNIKKNEISAAFQNTFNIMDEFDTDINSLTVRYQGYDFYISNKGVIDTDAPDNILKLFFGDESINKLILGMH